MFSDCEKRSPLELTQRYYKTIYKRLSLRLWRGDRVADCAALEMLCCGNATAGSNPALSAIRGLSTKALAFGSQEELGFVGETCFRDVKNDRSRHWLLLAGQVDVARYQNRRFAV